MKLASEQNSKLDRWQSSYEWRYDSDGFGGNPEELRWLRDEVFSAIEHPKGSARTNRMSRLHQSAAH